MEKVSSCQGSLIEGFYYIYYIFIDSGKLYVRTYLLEHTPQLGVGEVVKWVQIVSNCTTEENRILQEVYIPFVTFQCKIMLEHTTWNS